MRLALAGLVAACAPVAAPQTDASAKLPGASVERDTTPMITTARLAGPTANERAAWQAYIARSQEVGARDRALVADELRRLGRTVMTRAPYLGESFVVTAAMTDAFFQGASARAMARTMVSFQTPSGGWSKHVDMTQPPRAAGQSFFSEDEQWHYIATLDNNSTTSELVFLGRLERAQPDTAHRNAFVRGLHYLFDAQMPNGCWPQVFPLQGGYHDAVTYNDDAMANAVNLLLDASADTYAFIGAADREAAAAAVSRAERCIRTGQVVVGGVRTIWGQQQDPLTLAPVDARSYEHASLAPRESVALLAFLLTRPNPDADLVAAIHAAADWFAANRLTGIRYQNYVMTKDASAPPIWARMAEIGTNRPIFSNRDGRILYDWNELTDRREGYGWFTDAPSEFLKLYDAWARKHPRTG